MIDLSLTSANAISMTVRADGILPGVARYLPIAAELALNRTAQEAVAIVRVESARQFRRRNVPNAQAFFDQSFTVTQFAKRDNLTIAFGVPNRAAIGNQDVWRRSAVLFDHEEGAVRTARTRQDFPYLPAFNSLRGTMDDMMPRWSYPRALGLLSSDYSIPNPLGADKTPVRRGSKRGLRARENRKGFILRREDDSPIAIFRRVPMMGMRLSGRRANGKTLTKAKRRRRSAEQSTLEVLFWTPRQIIVRPRLQFRRNALAAMERRIEENYVGMMRWLVDRARRDRTREMELTNLADLRARFRHLYRGAR